jgi:hypothetical protein
MLVKLISVLIGVCTTQVTGIAALSCGDVVDGVLTVPRFTTHIVDNALVGCNTLVRVDIDQSGLLYSIGNAAFKGCVNLEVCLVKKFIEFETVYMSHEYLLPMYIHAIYDIEGDSDVNSVRLPRQIGSIMIFIVK